MKKIILSTFVLFLYTTISWGQNTLHPNADLDKKVSELLSKMTIEEKIGQVRQITVTHFEDKGKSGVFNLVKLAETMQD